MKQTIVLDEENAGPLIVLLNIELRNRYLSLDHAEAYNQVFKQLLNDSRVGWQGQTEAIPCGDHESMAWRRA